MTSRVGRTGLVGVLLLVLVACGEDSGTDAGQAERSTSTSGASAQSTGSFACEPEQTDCSAEEVIATVAELYRLAGASPEEAACLAPITGAGKTTVNQALDAPSAAETTAAIECVGSPQRLSEIGESLGTYLAEHQP